MGERILDRTRALYCRDTLAEELRLRRAASAARPSAASAYGVMVVAKASVRLLVLPLFVCTKNDLNAVPLSASPW